MQLLTKNKLDTIITNTVVKMKGIQGTEYVAYIKSQKIFKVSKRLGNEYRYLGSHKSLICALMIRDWCQANNWKPYSPPFKYISKNRHGNYSIYKYITETKRQVCFGTFKTFKEAEKEVEKLKRCNWDIEALCNIDERIDDEIIYLNRRMT